MSLARALDTISEGAQVAHHEARRQALDACVQAIAEQLLIASAALLYQVPPSWDNLSMQGQAVFLNEAKAIVAQRSAVMRLRAKGTMLDKVSEHCKQLADDILLESDHWLIQQSIGAAFDELHRALIAEYEAGR